MRDLLPRSAGEAKAGVVVADDDIEAELRVAAVWERANVDLEASLGSPRGGQPKADDGLGVQDQDAGRIVENLL